MDATLDYTENRLTYDLAGPEGAPPVVLVHGSVVTRHSWAPQVAALAERYRVIVPDLPGHGTRAAERFTLEGAVGAVLAAVTAAAGGMAVLVGVSLGGHVATLFAQRCPNWTAGLAISGASMNFHGVTGRWTRFAGVLMQRFFGEARLRDQAAQSLRRKWPAEIAEAQIAAGLFPRPAWEAFQELPDYDFRSLLAEVQTPVLILNGELDRPNQRGASEFATVALNARLATVPGAGHACNLENPDGYNRELLAFLEEIGW